MSYGWMWLLEIRSSEAQSRGEVFSSIILASLQMLDDGGRFFLGEGGRHLAEHLVGEGAHVFVGPALSLGERKDGGELPGREAAVLRYAVRFAVASGGWAVVAAPV